MLIKTQKLFQAILSAQSTHKAKEEWGERALYLVLIKMTFVDAAPLHLRIPHYQGKRGMWTEKKDRAILGFISEMRKAYLENAKTNCNSKAMINYTQHISYH